MKGPFAVSKDERMGDSSISAISGGERMGVVMVNGPLKER